MFSVGTYSQLPFSDKGSVSVAVSVTGVVGTSQLGNVSAGQFITVIPTGVQAQGKVGNLGEFVNGVQGTTSIGPYSVAVQGNVNIILQTPVTGTTKLGNPIISAGGVFEVTGVSATASVGPLTVSIDVVAKPRQNEDFTITVKSTASGNKYFVNGVQQQMPTALHKGFTYKFDQSDSSNNNHPMRFSTTDNGSWNGGSEYTDGVTVAGTPGQSGAYTQIVVASNAPSQLYTYCLNHSGMGFGVTVGVNVEIKGSSIVGTGSIVSAGVTVFPSGTLGTTGIGTVAVSLSAEVDVIGVSASVSTSNVLVWSEIDTTQDPKWVEIAA